MTLNQIFVSKKLLPIAFVTLIISMLYIGLKDDVPSKNQVHYSENDGALIFGERALAYSKSYLQQQQIDVLNARGFEIKINFSPVSFENNHFQFLLLISDGNPDRQLIIAQVRDYIIVMNGDDYNHSKNTPRIRIKISNRFKGYQQLSLRVDKRRTSLSLSGLPKVTRKGALVKIPSSKTGVRLLLSANEILDNNWRGAIKSLSISSIEKTDQRHSLVNFDAKHAPIAIADSAAWLLIPEKLTMLKRVVLEAASFNINSQSTIRDMLLNVFGFIPFGLLLAAILQQQIASFGSRYYQYCFVIMLTFIGSLSLSFAIEYSQSWLITRHSSLQDLYLNSLGGTLGALLLVIYYKLQEVVFSADEPLAKSDRG
ncbi:VanZ family protein ['Osedax' symbiont bacterium Rs2_46_30_T18]|nr:VanZ family protein ['Osedax' symbiont bacterium Rs2_46_30_T18]